MSDIRTTTTADAGKPASRGLGRRSVLRTAAWSVPAVTIAAASPAYAASDALALAFGLRPVGTFTVRPRSPKLFFGSIAVENPTGEATQNLRITVTVPTVYASLGAPISMKINGGKGDWAPPAVSTITGNYVLTFTALTQLPRKSDTVVTFSMELNGTLPSPLPSIGVTATATGFTQISDTFVPVIDQ